MPGHERVVAVIGAGAAGVLVAHHLLDSPPPPGTAAPRVVLIDPAEAVGRGVAYGTEHPGHLLNVPAGRMSARADDPADFVRWLRAHWRADAGPADFAPRMLFGRYLAAHLAQARRAGTHLTGVRDRVVGVTTGPDGLTLELGSAPSLRVHAAVLASGVHPAGTSWAPGALLASDRFVPDPWAPGALAAVPDRGDVLLVGTGLTMVDVATTLARPGRAVHAVSRHGRLPRAHARVPAPAASPAALPVDGGLAGLRAAVSGHVRTCLRERRDWRPAIDGLRPLTARLWTGLSSDDRARFLAEDARTWEIHRHRMPPAVARQVAGLRGSGRLVVGPGEVLDAAPAPDGLDVTLAGGRRLRVAAVVNCTGSEPDPARTADPLAHQLLTAGLARPGPLGMGYDTASDGRLLGTGARLWTLGSTRRGSLWESTAFPEIRQQAADVAAVVVTDVLAEAPTPARRRPRDRYGLPLSTTAEAAAVFDRAVDLVLDVRSGAEDALAESVAADPGFAVGHAMLAVLAHERDRPADARRSLRRARAAGAARGDERERSFVGAVAELVGPGDAASLLRHLEDWPRDALAVSIAVPTIAFSGVAAGRESWELVEGLGGAYGQDPWYLAQLAFVRQDQRRFDEAEDLSTRALAGAPACGHAVHARTHVFYETGGHDAGLRWLDGWLAAQGPQANHRAHFSWHAALHELALGDDDAVRRRWADQLAPPAVSGPRALVDSASLVWRCRMTRRWTDALPIGALLDSVPGSWLDRPPTAFAALHAALALAAAGDTARLSGLRRYAAAHGGACFTGVIAPLCAALAGVVEERWAPAADGLAALMPRLVECGGSAAQREVVEETLIHALVSAGRGAEAARLLSDRLDRRPSRSDRDRLGALAG